MYAPSTLPAPYAMHTLSSLAYFSQHSVLHAATYTTYPWTTSALGAMHTHYKCKEKRKGLEEGGPFLFVSTLHIANPTSNAHSLLFHLLLSTLFAQRFHDKENAMLTHLYCSTVPAPPLFCKLLEQPVVPPTYINLGSHSSMFTSCANIPSPYLWVVLHVTIA